METPKSKKYEATKYWVCYQPKGDPYTHIRNFEEYEDALELYNAVRVLHREYEIPVRIELREFLETEHGRASKNILELDTIKEE